MVFSRWRRRGELQERLIIGSGCVRNTGFGVEEKSFMCFPPGMAEASYPQLGVRERMNKFKNKKYKIIYYISSSTTGK